MPEFAASASESRSERINGICLWCESLLPEKSRKDRKYCNDRCKRMAFDKRASEGRIASVRRLKSGKMSVVIHMGDNGFRPGDQVKVGK